MNIALTGGTGFVGRAFLDLAGDARHHVQALARQPQGGRLRVHWVAGDLADQDALARVVAGVDTVVHIAGVTSSHDYDDFEQGNVVGTLNLICAARAAGVKRFVFVSSLAAREPGLSVYGASKARAEKLVRASGLDWTIVRPPAVYGPGDRDMFELFRAARWGVVPVPGRGRTSVIHVQDLARLLMAIATDQGEMAGRVFECDDGVEGGWSHRELARAIAHAVGRRYALVLGQSRATMMLAAKADRMMRGHKARLTIDRASYFAHPDWVVAKRVAVPESLWRPRIETREGLRATANWYREAGWF